MKRLLFAAAFIILVFMYPTRHVCCQSLEPQVGGDQRPNYEIYRMDDIASQGEPGYSGDLNLSIPLLSVPGRHGHDFQVSIRYSSAITQRQEASWVGLGWSLDMGGVERSIIGRSDDQNERLTGDFNLGPNNDTTPVARAEKVGFLAPDHRNLSESDKDQCDMYSLVMGGASYSLLPVAIDEQQGELFWRHLFSTTPYNPWEIEAFWSLPSPISLFRLTKEDGARYTFGLDGDYGAVDRIHLFGRTEDSYYAQKFIFPSRWSLAEIRYPDGSATTIKYKAHNAWPNAVNKPYESIFIDRSRTWQGNYFSPRTTDTWHRPDSILCSFSSPDTLFTDTHYLVFNSSAPYDGEGTARNRRLNSLVLYDRATCLELKRITFDFAEDPNPNTWPSYDTPNWISGDRLKDNQLTLVGITIEHSAGGRQIPPYEFAYTKNPNVDPWFLATNSQADPLYPGYQSPDNSGVSVDYHVAWRLDSLKLPTGSMIAYGYQSLSGTIGSGYWVKWNPEGDSANSPTGHAFSYKAMPACRIIQKTVSDPLGPTQTWAYSYGEAVYDPPARPQYSTYRPRITFWNPDGFTNPNNYYQTYRSCSIGHRWVQTTEPDGSVRTKYYTSSYKRPDANVTESFPDFIPRPGDDDHLLIISRQGMRGLVWKETAPAETTTSYYSMSCIDTTTDLYKYEEVGESPYLQYVRYIALVPQLDSSVCTRDGISAKTTLCYNPTPLYRYISRYPWQMAGRCNGLLSSREVEGVGGDKRVSYCYASAYYPSLDSLHMLSQLYATTTRFNERDESKEWTTYEAYQGHWLPKQTYRWSAASYASSAPDTEDTPNAAVVLAQSFSYDSNGCADVVSATDANGNWLKYYYSSDTLNPFANNTPGLNSARVSGVERLRAPGPGSFSLLSPSNGGNGNVIGTMTWSSALNATSYNVYLDTSNPPASLYAQDVTGTTCAYSGLVPSSVYYWTIVAKNGDGSTEAVNGPWSFHSDPIPGSFDLVSPANGSTVTARYVTLRWQHSTGATAYDVYLAQTPSFPPTPSIANCTDTTVRTDQAADISTYYWKVVAKNAYGETTSNNAPWYFDQEGALMLGINGVTTGEGEPAHTNTAGFEGQSSSLEDAADSDISSLLTDGGTSVPDVLRSSYAYDHFGNVIRSVSENGDTTRYYYDDMGRLTKVIGPGPVVLSKYSYAYNLAYYPTVPNEIRTTAFRSAADSVMSALYYDGLGYECQRQTRLGGADIIAHTTYDAMRRKDKTYKPYEYASSPPHTFDAGYQTHASSYYSSADSYPYTRFEYYTDGSGRLKHSHAPGSLFQAEESLRYVRTAYGHEALGTAQGSNPSFLVSADAAWQPSSGTIDGVLSDGASYSDASYASMTFAASVYASAAFVVQMQSISGTPDPTGFYIVKYRCRKQSGGGRGGSGILSPESISLSVQLYEGTSYITDRVIFWDDLPASYQTFQFLVPVPLVSNPANCRVKVLASGQDAVGGAVYVSWVRLETFFPEVNVTTTTDENNVSQKTYIDVFGNTIASINDPGGLSLSTKFTYDGSGKPLVVINPQGQISTYDYNKRQLLMGKLTPDAGAVHYRYDLAGNLRFEQDSAHALLGKYIYRKYDRLNRVVEIGECTGPFTTADSTTSGSPSLDAPTSSITIVQRNIYDAGLGSHASARKLLGRLSCAVTITSTVADSTFYSYDEFGRVEWVAQKLSGLGEKKIAYKYDWQGGLTQLDFSDLSDMANSLSLFYEYDAAGRLTKISSAQYPDAVTSARVTEAQYVYLANGQVKRLQYGLAQGLDYQYNSRDWLTSINTDTLGTTTDPGADGANGIPADRFGMRLGYNELTGIGQGATSQFNGNIAWTSYYISGLNYTGANGTASSVGFTYAYDHAGRLTSADFGYRPDVWRTTTAYGLAPITYDNNGNISTMVRRNSAGSPIHPFAYYYVSGKNRLDRLTNVEEEHDYHYSYDANGNTLSDESRGVSSMTYDYRNLPLQATVSSQTLKFRYDGQGNRTYKEYGASNKSYYIHGANGETIAVYDGSGALKLWNLYGNGALIGKLMP